MRHEWRDDVDRRRYVIEPASIDPKHLRVTALTGGGPFTEQPVRREILRLTGQLDVQYRSMTIWQERALKAETENKQLRLAVAEAQRDLRTYVAHRMNFKELAYHMNNLLAIADRLHDLSPPSGAGAPADTSAPAPED